MPELTDLTGVASATKAKLNDAGIDSIDRLSSADPSALADRSDLGESKATKLVRRAKQQGIRSQTAADLLDRFETQKYISTGIDGLDGIIGGGLEPETLGLIYGSSGTGKTQVMFSAMGSASSEGTVVYLMTEIQSKSIADRLRSLSSSVDHLDNIHIYEAYDVTEQYEAYQAIGEDMDKIDLLVIDSFTAQFRTAEEFEGRENLGDRSTEIGRHLREIAEMSRVYQCPVLMAGQVYETPEAWGKGDTPYGGQKMEHFVSYFVRMSEGDGVLKEASLENHPGIPEESIQISIGEDSIDGAEE